MAESILIKAVDTQVPGLLCTPVSKDKAPVVLVFHGSDGFGPNHARIAQLLADEGIAALALTWFGATSSRAHWDMLRPTDILAATSYLNSVENVDAERIAMMGFSRGGALALIFGSMIPQTRCIINYFGLTAWENGLAELPHFSLNKEKSLDFVKNINSPILTFHGEKDLVVPVQNTIDLDNACREYKKEHRFVLYPEVNHSFIWPGDKYNPEAHKDSWQRSINFLKENLQ